MNSETDKNSLPPDPDHVLGTLRMRLWIEDKGVVLFGLGRLMLLQKISETGSLKAAAQALGMSYRAAWGKIKTTEKNMGLKLIEKQGCNRSGYRLSACGERLSRQYRDFFREVEAFALSHAHKLPLFELHGFDEE